MFTTTMKKSAAAVVLAFAGMGAAHADTVTSITITGGDFTMGATGTPTPFNGNTATITQGTTAQTMGSFFNFFGAPVQAFLASSATGAANANDWGSGFQGTTSGSTMSLNLGGWYAQWNGTNFLQGTDSAQTVQCAGSPQVCGSSSPAATGTISGNNFDVSWHSFIATAPFGGQTGYWHITGTFTAQPAAPVPVPAAAWLLGSGLLGLVGVARRRKAA